MNPSTPSPGTSPSRPGSRRGPPGHLNLSPPPQRKQVSFIRPSVAARSLQQNLNTEEDDKTSDERPRSKGRGIGFFKREEGESNEASPLLGSRQEQVEIIPNNPMSPTSSRDYRPESAGGEQETKSSWYLFLLTLALGGLQIAWSVELSNGSPYLLGLGISKSLLAFVWIAGPLSGTLVQPYVGIKSDNCRSKFGKRRPFMIGGACATIISLMALAWTRELMGGIAHVIFRVPRDSEGATKAAIVFAVLMIYVLDFSINVIQAGIRAFIVDNAPTHQQDSANAWASRMSGVGNIVGYLFGYVNLPKYLWFFGDTQFKVLCVIASLAMACSLTVSCISIKERDASKDEKAEDVGGVISFFKGLYHSMAHLPLQISRVCQVQFFAWIGWFPFLFYITTYIGEIYANYYLDQDPNMSQEDQDLLWERATRMGTFALLIFAFTTFAASIVLPFLVASSYQPVDKEGRTPMTPGWGTGRTPGITPDNGPPTPGGGYFSYPRAVPKTPITPHTPGGPPTAGGGYFAYQRVNSSMPAKVHNKHEGKSRLRRCFTMPESIEIKWLTLRRAWLLSHITFAVLMWLTFVVHNTTGATILTAAIGIPWAMTNWAPYALIAAEISKRDAIRRGDIAPPPTREGELLAQGEDSSDGADQAGVVLGIHNVAIAAPQVIATLVSSVIFRALQKPRGEGRDDSVAWVLRFGGLAALVAAYMTRRVMEEKND